MLQFERLTPDAAFPEVARAFAGKTVAQTREVYDRSQVALEATVDTMEKSFDAAGQGVAALNRKISDIAQRNLNSGFDLARQSHITQPHYSLERVALLAGLPSDSLERLQRSCSWRRYEPGEPIVEHLDRSDDVFFVTSGEARVIIYSLDGKVVSFRHVGPGDMFGEFAAVDGRPRCASVEARTSCIVASLPATAFRELLQTEPSVMQALLRQLVSSIRGLSTRVFEFSAHIMAITARRIYAEMQGIRARDKYPDEEIKAYLVDKTFPKNAEEITLKLSNVTAAFFGLTLAHIGDRFGWREANSISKTVFRKLGHLKAKEALELGVDVPKDSRAPALVFITAVHSASPEYNFEVFEYLPEKTVIRVFGTSQYDRIAKKLNIERYLTWPELIPFFEGVAEEMGVKCRIEGDLKELGAEGRYDCMYKFTCDRDQFSNALLNPTASGGGQLR